MKRKRLRFAALAATVVANVATATVATGVIVLTAREEGEHEGLVEGDVPATSLLTRSASTRPGKETEGPPSGAALPF